MRARGKTQIGTIYETRAAAEPRPALTRDLDVEVAVVGAGLAGLTVARELAQDGWSVVVLERGAVAGAASGRNTGFVLPGFAADAETIVARVGLDQARALWRLSEGGQDYVRDAVRHFGLPFDGADGWLHISKAGGEAHAAYARFLQDEIGATVEHWPRARVQAELASPLYFDAIHYPTAFSIDPLAYARALAAAAEGAGARIYENSPVTQLDTGGVRKRIVTPNGRVRAARVVLAGNVALGAARLPLAATLVPVTTYVAVTKPLGAALDAAMRYRGAVSDTEMANNHYRIIDGDRLMWSGRSTVWERNPRRYVNALCRDIAAAFPQIGTPEIQYCWSGTLGNTVHRMPQIGQFEPSVWIASGFGGHGLNTTAMAGLAIARGIAGRKDSWRLFEPFDLVWAGGWMGRATAQVYSFGYARREWGMSWASRRLSDLAAPQVVAEKPREAAKSEPDSVATEAPVFEEIPKPLKALRKKRRPKQPRTGVEKTASDAGVESRKTERARSSNVESSDSDGTSPTSGAPVVVKGK